MADRIAPRIPPRVALLVLGGISMLGGLNAALVLLGVWAPVAQARMGALHGMVMVLGFMGTVIALERAQALRQAWAYLAPGLLGAGGISLVVGVPVPFGQLLLLQGALMLVVVYLFLWRRAPLPLVGVQVLAAVAAAVAAGLWLVVDLPLLIPWLAAFVVLTIAAERAELAQLSMGGRATPVLLTLAVGLTLSAASTLLWPGAGSRLFGLVVLLTALWLAHDDVARRMVRTTGLRRYNGVALLLGYTWLGVAGLAWIAAGSPVGQAAYDVVIHGVFLGFGVSMIMAHAPIIFPTVLGRPLPYRRLFWVPLLMLHLAMALRVAGDVLGVRWLWQAGGVGGVLAMIALVLVILTTAVRR